MKKAVVAGVVLVAALLVLFVYQAGQNRTEPDLIVEDRPAEFYPQEPSEPDLEPALPDPEKTLSPAAPPKKAPKPKPSAPPEEPVVKPPEVQVFKELIPKDIEIVRVYYPVQFAGPESILAFSINGTGFNEEFQKMIEVRSGVEGISVQNLSLKTANQIWGEMKVGPDVKTQAVFPQVLIQGKVVFQAHQPFAVIRPREVLNLVFTHMDASGRSGQFRVFTNLSPTEINGFEVRASTPTIRVRKTTHQLPFIVDGAIIIGGVPSGGYDLFVDLEGETIWERAGIIQIVQPNMGDTGLVQRVLPADQFYRPGDEMTGIIQGSGFRPEDPSLLSVAVEGLDLKFATMTYAAPGQLDLKMLIPRNAPVGPYKVEILHGDKSLIKTGSLFSVVPENWTRNLSTEPPLRPGTTAQLVLTGRDMSPEFVNTLTFELDESLISIGAFSWQSATQAVAPIKAAPTVRPGDYWIRLSDSRGPVVPSEGSIIRVLK